MQNLLGSPYQAYVYAYPHKTAYRTLTPAIPLERLWASEDKAALFLYVHVPFCEMRCGFCNLFTTANPKADVVASYLESLARQARRVRQALGASARFARFAVGGGTPTFLTPAELESLFRIAEVEMGVRIADVPSSVEASPETVDGERLAVLRAFGVERISMGVQSFDDAEATAVGRPQSVVKVERALHLIREAGIPTLNVDLIYGLPGQTEASFRESLRRALAFRPEEIYLYPLYVRPLTGLGRSARSWDDERLRLYRAGRDTLREQGYLQSSMRMFRAPQARAMEGPVYCVQDDGMVGLGCGARSYTRDVHYGSDYAVSGKGVREILARWLARDDAAFDHADHGFRLDGDEERRRYLTITLLGEGVDLRAYTARFGSDALADVPLLAELVELELAACDASNLRLTDEGVARSDAIGPALFSSRVTSLMSAHELT